MQLTAGPQQPLVSRILAQQEVTCALASGQLYCWGYNQNGQTGTGSPGDSSPGLLDSGGGTVKSFAPGGGGGCALVEQASGKGLVNHVYCWG